MHALLRLGYDGAIQLARAAARVAPPGDDKTLRALHARRDVLERWAAWARASRDTSRPLLWIHAPSVGEGLQARPVLERLRAHDPRVQLAYSFFSPSAEAFAQTLDVDVIDYLPFDSAADARAMLRALRPTALVFSKLDVWPVLSAEAQASGVRLGLISGTVREASARRGSLARALLADAYGVLDVAGAVSTDDAERLIELGVRRSVVSITGDTRYDQVWARAARIDGASAVLAPLRSDRPTLVAGSTWPPDEHVLAGSWPAVRGRVTGARLVVAPHEPTALHLTAVERWAASAGLTTARLDDPRASAADVVLVDRVGVLGDLYALADVAFVGGAFHAAGLHSVLEPAAFGVPVLFGPQSGGNRDASLLIAAGGGASVATADSLADQVVLWLSSAAERRLAGDRARAVVRDGLGAADRSVALVQRLLGA